MKKWFLLTSAILSLLMIVSNGCLAGRSTTINFRLVVEVETPEGLKIGSVVRSVTRSSTHSWLPDEGGTSYIIHGEAVVVDLGARGLLFALTEDEWAAEYIFNELRQNSQRVEVEYVKESFPIFVHFRDIDDPTTVEPVLKLTPDRKNRLKFLLKQDRTEEIFGKGVKIKSVNIRITEEPVTWSGLPFLKWIESYQGKRLDGHRDTSFYYENQFANKLSTSNFTRIGH